MSAIVCGSKRSNFFEDLQSTPSSPSSSPPVSKRIRCSPSSFSPPRSSSAATIYFSTPSSAIDHLLSVFPDMDKQLLERALEECGDDLDSAIKRLNELRLGSAENLGPLTGRSDATQEIGSQILTQGNGGPIPTEDSSAAKELHMESTEWVELFVREMMSASNIDDAKARASRALEVLEKSICARAKEATARDVQQENNMLKQQVEALIQENSILKRAFAIQRERQKEFEDRGHEVNQLKQLVAQYQEQLRTLEVNNYALSMHLKQAQQSNSIPGRFHPDVF
ncbi:uncharacterized protein LOC107766032 [Nicotiana tabacum]|uniref:Uncharacterized protein LOC107766032 n=2 Tax=Nicotiana TaxID=4085 RepID=A0A1S3XK65_TOBAC|nr:PREDICTED: uncharacterized protein LOC104227539 [Nicotiana sylvestris]XP_016440229.1 PREDICTED: uncharacterized protein LOC107766032 [Nicotiana tabacum]